MPLSTTPFSGCSGPLPIVGLELSGSFVRGKTHLNWTTLSEVDNDFFTLERSTKGTAFTTVGVAHGAGTSYDKLTYSLTDPHPGLGVNYYRVRQTDFDGSTSYSNTIAIFVRATGFELTSLYPNPTVDHIHARFRTSQDELLNFEVFDIHGRLQLSVPLRAKAGLNEAALDLEHVPTGVYFLRIVGYLGVLSARFIKQ